MRQALVSATHASKLPKLAVKRFFAASEARRAVAEVLEVHLVEHGAVEGDGLAAAKLAVVVERVVRRAAVGAGELRRGSR
jgi:ribosomal protein L17